VGHVSGLCDGDGGNVELNVWCPWPILFSATGDIFVIRPQSSDKLKDFLYHLNSIHQSIQSTMEIESEGHLPFLGIHIYR
jgi:hypothetical protein